MRWLNVLLGVLSSFYDFPLGSLLQIGDVSASIFTNAIAVHTFRSLVLRRNSSPIITILVVAFGFGASISLGTPVLSWSHDYSLITSLSYGLD